MADWKTDGELESIAVRCAEKVLEALQIEDERTGLRVAGDAAGLTDVMTGYAAEFTTIDPAELVEQYEHLRAIAGESGDESSVLDELRLTTTYLSGWHGDASDEFHQQVSRIEVFMANQRTNVVYAMQGLDSAYTANVTARQSYYDLCAGTIEAATAAIEQYEATETKAVIAALTEIPRTIFDAAVGTSLTSAIGAIVTVGQQRYDLLSLAGTAYEVLDNYDTYAGNLTDAYEESLNGAAAKLNNASEAMLSTKVELLEPLPAKYADIHSPDFSYQNFCSAERDTDSFSAGVREAAKDTPQDTDEEESDIARALNPEGEKLAS